MPSMYATNTNVLTTDDWVNATKDMKLWAYEPPSPTLESNKNRAEPTGIVGTHIKEAVAIVKDWIEDNKE
jgi:hypothetical protein